jgi:tetratricopeptide (TPR) repeat protein/DNA-binding SARP family transcriptional activator
MTLVRLAIVGNCVIEVDGSPVTPASSHLFGLLLFLSLRAGKPTGRTELHALLADSEPIGPSSHSLRQLLYRLRRMGLRFYELPTGLTLRDAEIVGPLDELRQGTLRERCRLTAAELEVLPSYVPRLPRLFMSWLDDVKSDFERQVRQLLLADLEASRVAHAWADVEHLCETLTSLDAANAEVACNRAEALAMTGRRDDALRVLDTFIEDAAPSMEAHALLQSTRSRIVKTTITRREGTLRARASCLTLLEGEWEKLPLEGARVTAVLGQAGLGKTRVAEEFATRIAFRGAHVLRFACDSQARQQPLSLFSHILPSLRGMRGSLGAAPEYKASLALVRPANDGMEPTVPEGLSLEARRADIQSGIIDLLEAVTSERPLLLVVDDAHMLDEASRAVLRALTTTRNAAALQVLVCARPSSGNPSLLAAAGRRSSMYELAPLSQEDSLELLLELGAGSDVDDAHVKWCLAQAAGNPFYLHQLATHAPSTSSALPFDISSLALSSYSSLRPESRAVLETCLLLGRFATMTRAIFVAGIDDHMMLAALRELEEQDLVRFVDGYLSGPHALLHDALRDLIPSSVGALLHRRIAARLQEECVADRFTPELAWASAQSWLAAADPAAAMHLLQRCAAHAADVGEPAAAVDLLSQVPSSALPPRLLADLLDDLSRYAHTGGCRAVAVTALRGRLALARDLGEDADRINSVQLLLVEAELFNGGPTDSASHTLMTLLMDSTAAGSVRAKAAARLFAIADSNLDSELANVAYSFVRTVAPPDPYTESLLEAAQLVYHTAFGDLDVAYALASRLLASYPEPNRGPDAIRARMYAAFAFYRIGHSDLAESILTPDFEYMLLHRVYGEALYAASVLSDMAIVAGDFETATRWFTTSRAAARGDAPHQLNPNAGFGSNAGVLAMRDGRYEEAKEYFIAPVRHYTILSGARYRGVMLSQLLRIQQLSSGTNQSAEEVAALRDMHEKAKHLGSQDTTVEALWCALVLDGDCSGASRLLRDYLMIYRRERSLPAWSLRHATAADEAWQEYDARSPTL